MFRALSIPNRGTRFARPPVGSSSAMAAVGGGLLFKTRVSICARFRFWNRKKGLAFPQSLSDIWGSLESVPEEATRSSSLDRPRVSRLVSTTHSLIKIQVLIQLRGRRRRRRRVCLLGLLLLDVILVLDLRFALPQPVRDETKNTGSLARATRVRAREKNQRLSLPLSLSLDTHTPPRACRVAGRPRHMGYLRFSTALDLPAASSSA